jgi:hypothetical protein
VEWKFKNRLDGAAYSSRKFYSLESRSVKNEVPFMHEKIVAVPWELREIKVFCEITDQLNRRRSLNDYQYFLIILTCARKWREF